MSELHKRSAAMLTEAALQTLRTKKVLVFGLGGVGGHAAEALARGGIGSLVLIDGDVFDLSNCNRQLFATQNTLGMKKTEAAKERLLQIDPTISVTAHSFFYGKDPDPQDLFEKADYILDAIDTVSSKLLLIETAKKRNIPIISCMGTGNKLDPTAFQVSDLYETQVCPLARVMRTECRKRGIDALKVVYSREIPVSCTSDSSHGRHAPGSVSFVPGVAGMIMAGEIIKDLIGLCIS